MCLQLSTGKADCFVNPDIPPVAERILLPVIIVTIRIKAATIPYRNTKSACMAEMIPYRRAMYLMDMDIPAIRLHQEPL